MMKCGAFVAVCVAGAALASCSAAGDADVLKFDGSAGPPDIAPPAADTAVGEANVPVQPLAVPCNATTPCTDPVANFCYTMTTGSGYCTTSGCTSSQGCPTGFFCDQTLSPSVCRLPPTGEGTPCTAAGECAAFEASYCELSVSRSCLVAGCSEALNNCDDTHLCCDFAFMGLPSICVEKALMAGGKCYKP